jgi:hypothetical protein
MAVAIGLVVLLPGSCLAVSGQEQGSAERFLSPFWR